jgi:hypothetical protein
MHHAVSFAPIFTNLFHLISDRQYEERYRENVLRICRGFFDCLNNGQSSRATGQSSVLSPDTSYEDSTVVGEVLWKFEVQVQPMLRCYDPWRHYGI